MNARAYKNFGFVPSFTGKQTKGMLAERLPEGFPIRVIERFLFVERCPIWHASKS